MKKLLQFLFLIAAFFSTKEVFNAASANVTLGDIVPNSRVHLKTSNIELDMNVNYIRDLNSNELLYCIEPGVQLYDGVYQKYDIYNTPPEVDSKKMTDIAIIAYYGYGYKDRTDIKWYITTQFMIWDYVLQDRGEIYFIDDHNNKINPYENEINIIKEDVANHYRLPSFIENRDPSTIVDKIVPVNEDIVYYDENNIISEYTITTTTPHFTHKVEGNKLTMNFDLDGSYNVFFAKKYNLDNPRVYLKTGSQKVISRGSPATPQGLLTFEIQYPKLTINKSGVKDEILSRKNATYIIYHEDGSPYLSTTTGEDGSVTIFLKSGKYYLQEVTAPYGYELNSEKVYFEITTEDISLDVEDNLILNHIVIEKYLENYDSTYNLEPNAEFKLMREGKLYKIVKTDALGKIELDLPYGNYTLIQTKGKVGYKLCEELKFNIAENFSAQRYILKNKQITGSLNLTKINSLTNEVINDPIKFKIRNKATNEYLNINNIDTFTTELGKLTLSGIPYGEYEIIEVEAPDIYKKLEQIPTFKINEDLEEINLSIYNTPKTGAINIIKTDSRNNLPLSNVIFGLYNSNKELIQKLTTNELGQATLENIPIGKYYLKELLTNADYELNAEEIAIDIKENTSSTLNITNRLKAIVPITGTKEFLITIILSVICLSLGVYICNHNENH